MKKIVSIMLAAFMLCSFSASVFANGTIDGSAENELNQEKSSYEYKVTPGDKEWAEFTSTEQMLDATQIPSDVLNQMTTEELVDAVLDFPLIINIYAYDSYEDGLKALAKDSDAFNEILKRPDAGEKLLNKLTASQTMKSEDSLQQLTLSVLLTENTIWESVENKEVANKMLRATNTTVKTPKGSNVSVIIRGEEMTSAEKASLNNSYVSAYPSATLVSTSTSNYNCHAYAWYSDSTSNQYWMNSPSAYMTDGSYTSFTNLISAVIGTRVYYDNGEHSGIVYEAGGPLASTKYLKVISKWGMAPLMKHRADYSPYSSDYLTMWKKA
jgi:uncharacterized protein YxeA